MRRSATTFSNLVAGLLILLGRRALAQACCAGVSLLSPARLTPHEDALVAVQVSAGLQVGSVDGAGHFRSNPSGAGGADFGQAVVGSVRVLGEGQVSAVVPFNEGLRWAPGVSDVGGGLGDVSLAFRYDFLLAGESTRIPGLAVLAGLAFPTGRTIERAKGVLSADATGAGLWQGTVGLGVEQSWRQIFAQATLLVQQGLPRSVYGLTETLGPSFSLGLAAGWVFESGGAIALLLKGATSLPAWINGVSTPKTERTQTAIGVGSAFPLSDVWRLQGSLNWQLPLGQNELTSVTLTVLLMRTWS